MFVVWLVKFFFFFILPDPFFFCVGTMSIQVLPKLIIWLA